MKLKYTLAALAAAAALTVGAATPEVVDGLLVITLDAPRTSRIDLVGEIIPTGRTNMIYSEHNGRWEYIVRPGTTSPGLYTYSFDIDGRDSIDTSSTCILTTDQGETLNYAIVPGKGAEPLADNPAIPHGTVVSTTYHSPEWGDRPVMVYTPAGFDPADTSRRYPVLYLLHGRGGNQNSWLTQGRAARQLDYFIAGGQAVPMIVVMPDSNIPGHDKDGVFELDFPNLMAAIDTTYPTIQQPEGRAIAGLSMGGFHAMNISRYLPGTFDFVGLFSPTTVDTATDPTAEPYRDADAALRRQFEAGLQLYFVAMGQRDPLIEPLTEYLARMQASDLPTYYLTSPDGHTWHAWRSYLTEFLPLIFK